MIWGDYSLEKNDEITLSLQKALHLHVARVENEIWVAFDRAASSFEDAGTGYTGTKSVKTEFSPDEAEEIFEERKERTTIDYDGRSWSRWALMSSEPRISVQPVFPDMPFVVRPDYEFRLAPKASARIYTRIPIAVSLHDASNGMLKLTEINSVNLVKTWFGTFEGGEVCYWLSTTASRTVRQQMVRQYRCYCPLVISNDSSEFLHVDKLCIRVDRLSIFSDGERLWSDEMFITHKGSDGYSDLVVNGKPPPEAPNSKLIGKPRNPVKRGIAERTFKVLNQLPQIRF